MMTPRIISLTGLSIMLVACAAPSANDTNPALDNGAGVVSETSTVELGPAIATVKPGASVSFSHETSGAVQVDGNGYVVLTLNEGYPSGTLSLVATSDEGLEVTGSGATTTVNMADGTTHSWRVDFRGLSDGVHYLKVRATADTGEARGYAVRVEVGDWKTAEAAREAAKPMAMQADGEMAVVMEADETIEPAE